MTDTAQDARRAAQQRLAEGLNRLLARVVALDPEARRRLRGLEGRSVAVTLEGPDVSFHLTCEDRSLVAAPGLPEQIGARLTATPGAFLALAASGGAGAVGKVSVEGDAETARRYQQFFAELKPDWEDALSRLFGDVVGFQMAQLLRRGASWLKSTGQAMSTTGSEYLREESRQLVTRPEMERFLDAVDDLRDDVARLEARLSKRERG